MRKVLMSVLLMLVFTLGASANTVQLKWNRNSETDVTGYNMYRSTTSGSFTSKLNSVLIPQTSVGVSPSYVDTTALNITYYYVVRAVNAAGLESQNSNQVTAMPLPPGAPSNLTIESLTTASLFIDNKAVKTVAIGLPLSYSLRVVRNTTRIIAVVLN